MKPEDLKIPMDVTDAWISMHMVGQPSTKVAAARAFASAKMNPGTLIKITCHDREEVVLTVDALSIMVSNLDYLADKNHPTSKSPDGWPILELKNKSGIMIVVEKAR